MRHWKHTWILYSTATKVYMVKPLFPSRQTPTYLLTMTGIVANGRSLVATGTYSEMVVDSGSFWTFLCLQTFDRKDWVMTQSLIPLNFSWDNIRDSSYICFVSRTDILYYKQSNTCFQRLVHHANDGDDIRRRSRDSAFAFEEPIPQPPRLWVVHELHED
jgi:hypothetical protein